MKKIKTNHAVWIVIIAILIIVAVLNKMNHQCLMNRAFEGAYLPLIVAVIVGVIIFVIKCVDGYNDMKNNIEIMNSKGKRLSEMKQWIRDIGVAMLIVLAITTFIKPTIVHGTSMNPTLQDGDYLLVSKQAYTFEEPERGEIIIFPVGEDNKLYIKRVIGLPGDVITIKNGEVYVNGEVNDQNYTLDGYTSGNIDELVVPDGEVFVLGDNRLNSIDSREIGTQEIEDVKGVAFMRLWPPAAFGKLN